MKIYTGLLKEISQVDPDKTGHKKQRVVIEEEFNQLSEIEFNGARMLTSLSEFQIQDRVIIAACNKGSRSRKSGKFHNNIIAKSIKRQ